ncbi:MAG: PqqD family protein [Planctomycetota bacterium]|nr:PqqD family protein [Planctomycetota bacterium]
MAQHWTRATDVVWEEFDGEAVLVSSSAKGTWVLNPTACFVWKNFDGRTTLEAIVRHLAAAAGLEPSRVKQEVLAFCAELEREGLVSAARQAARGLAAAPPQCCFAGAYVRPVIRISIPGFGLRGKATPRGPSGP